MESVEDFIATLKTLELEKSQKGVVNVARVKAVEKAIESRASFIAPRTLLMLRTHLGSLQGLSPSVTISLPVIYESIQTREKKASRITVVGESDDALESSENLLHDLDGVQIEKRGVIPAFSIINCKNCVMKLGACVGALALEDVQECTVYVACHQVRLSRCSNLSIFLYVATNVTTENSIGTRISELVPWYESLPLDMTLAGLTGKNNCRNVVDFTDI